VPPVDEAQRDDVVPPRELPERAVEALVEEVADQEDVGAALEHAAQVVAGQRERGARAQRLAVERLARDAEGLPRPRARRQLELDRVREEQQARLSPLSAAEKARIAASSAAAWRTSAGHCPGACWPRRRGRRGSSARAPRRIS
jgi:hypothetical protein